jgi:parvulin-like peptidyl-prolyl isomerase
MKRLRPRWVASVATLAIGAALARAEVVDEIVAKVNDDIVTKSDLETEEQGALQELYRRFSGTELDKQVAEAKKEMLRHLVDRRVLIQRAAHIFDMTKMQELLADQGMTLADLKTRLVEEFAPQQVIRAEVAERIAVSEKDARAYYEAHTADFDVPAQATVREIVVKASDSDRESKRQAAEAVRAKVAEGGTDFAAVAADVSDAGTKKAGGLLGTVKKGDLAEALDKAAFTVPVGEVSAVIEAGYGFHILKVDARIDEALKPFDDVKAEIETKIQNERFATEYKNYMKKSWTEATIWIAPQYQSRLSPVDASN